ncbi:MAG: type I polyketide synthase [Pseudomonadota bacterium]
METVAEFDVVSEVRKTVESTLKMPSGKLDMEAGFESFGMDSIIAMELMSNLSKRFNISITPAQFTNLNTVKELADLIEIILNGAKNNAVKEAKVNTQNVLPKVQSNSSVSLPNPTKKSLDTSPKLVSSNYRAAKPVASFAERSLKTKAINKKQDQLPLQKLISYVQQKYSIDLARNQYATIDEIVDSLVSEHLNELMYHYNISDDFVTEENLFDTENADASLLEGSSEQYQKNGDIAIVGLSCKFPDAANAQVFWDNLMSQKNSIREIPKSRWDWEEYYAESASPKKTISKWGALIDDVDCFDAHFFKIPAEHAKLMDPQERLLLQETYKAFQDANIDVKKLAGSDTGVFLGYEYAEYEQYIRKNINHTLDAPIYSSSSPTYYLANRLSYLFDFCGPSESVNTNCASSAVAINRAYYSLLNGESKVAVAGGVSLNLFVDDYIYATQYGMLSGDGTCGVFDNNANGFTRGEGVGVVILKRLDDAKKDNNRIYGVIKSCQQNNRGNANSLSEIKHESITKVISECYDKAAIAAESVNYIEVDGYSTKWGDSFEFEGIKNAFKSPDLKQKHCALGSVKGNIGHLEPASGMASIIKIALSLHNKKFPATITKKTINEFIDIKNPSHPLYIADTEISFASIRENSSTPIRAGINSFADSGANVHILVEEYMAEIPASVESNAPVKQLFVLSGKDRSRLETYIKKYIDFLSGAGAATPFANMIYSLQIGRESMDERLAIVAASNNELLEKLRLVMDLGVQEQNGLEGRGIYFGNLEKSKNNPLVSLITKDMSSNHIEKSLQTQQWQQIALLWVNGVSVPWEKIWERKSVQGISLPSYPFTTETYWIGRETNEVAGEEKIQPARQNVKQHALKSAPGNDTERKLVSILAEIFNLSPEAIGVDDDFFELGGNSQQVMLFIGKIKEQFGQMLPPAILFTAPNIVALAKLILSGNSTAFDILIPMQTEGDKQPIFAMPGAGGSVISLQPLSQALGKKQPFYGLQAVGFDGDKSPLDSIEKMATANIAALKTVQASGPYTFVGYSNGGVVAFEMARMLLEQNEKIASLILLDSLCPLLQTNDVIDEIVDICNSVMKNRGVNLNLDIQQLQQIPGSERCDYLYNLMAGQGFEMPREQFTASYNVAIASENCCRIYKPLKLSQKIDVTLYRALNGYPEIANDYGWNQLLMDPIRTCDINADHLSIVDNEPIQEVAKNINLTVKKKKK